MIQHPIKKYRFSGPLIVSLIIPLVSSCTFKNLEAPNWDVTYQLPLINRTFTMQEDLIDDNDPISVDDQDRIVYTIDEPLDPFDVSKELRTNGAKKDFSIYIGKETDTTYTNTDFLIEGYQVIVDSAKIRRGRVRVEIQNTSPYSMDVKLTTPSLIDDQQNPFSIEEYIERGKTKNLEIPMEGWAFVPEASSEGNQAHYEVRTIVRDGYSDQTEEVHVKLTVDTLYFEEVSGWFDQKEFNIDSVDTKLDVPSELQGIELSDVLLQINLINTIQIPGRLDLTIRGENEKGESAKVNVSKEIAPGNSTILVTGLESIVNLIPDRIQFFGKAVLGQGFGGPTAKIRRQDHIEGDLLFTIPLVFSVSEKKINEIQVDTLDTFDKDARDLFDTNLKSATLIAEVENRLPVGFTISILFSNTIGDSTLYLPGKADLLKSWQVEACPTVQDVNGDFYKAVDPPQQSSVTLNLEQNDFKLFSKEHIYMGIRMEFPGTVSSTNPLGMVKIDPSDYVTIRARAEATMNTTFPEDEE